MNIVTAIELLVIFVVLGWLMTIQIGHAGEVPIVGEAAPDFNLPDQNGQMRSLKEFSGKWLVLYFYPKDDTPGCTKEACAFRDDLNQISGLGAQVVGVSVDDTASHAEFAKKYHLPFPLLSDKTTEVAARYGALRNMFFMKVARRYTFLIDPQGKIGKVYLSVETSRHSKEIIEDLKILTTRSKR